MPIACAGIHVRIYATGKQIVKIGVTRLPLKNRATDWIPRESREMSYIKNKGMAPNDRFRHDFRDGKDGKNLIGSRPCGEKLFAKQLAVRFSCGL
jgi:hypothetical protein